MIKRLPCNVTLTNEDRFIVCKICYGRLDIIQETGKRKIEGAMYFIEKNKICFWRNNCELCKQGHCHMLYSYIGVICCQAYQKIRRLRSSVQLKECLQSERRITLELTWFCGYDAICVAYQSLKRRLQYTLHN